MLLDALTGLGARTAAADLPAEALQAARQFILDGLAVGVAGRRGPYREAVFELAAAWGGDGPAQVLGDDRRLPPAAAAFVNAYQMHCLEFDCVHEGAVAHALTAPLAAALAEADRTPVAGDRFIAAIVLGVETGAVLGLAARAPLSFFRPATTGVFGAAMAVGAMRGYDAERLRCAFGHALSFASGTMQAHDEGMPTLPVQLGNAARNGLLAADLAAAGMPAPRDSLEGRYGYLRLFETAADATGLADSLGAPLRIGELSHKPFPSGRATHGGIQAVLALREQGVAADDVAAIRLAAPSLIHQLVIRPVQRRMDANYARLCFAYVGAVALMHGAVGLEHFAPRRLDDATFDLAQRISAEACGGDDPAAFTPQRLTAELRDGGRCGVTIDSLLGSPRQPLDPAQRAAKVAACLASVYAEGDRCRRLADAVDGLIAAEDASAVLAAAVGAPP